MVPVRATILIFSCVEQVWIVVWVLIFQKQLFYMLPNLFQHIGFKKLT